MALVLAVVMEEASGQPAGLSQMRTHQASEKHSPFVACSTCDSKLTHRATCRYMAANPTAVGIFHKGGERSLTTEQHDMTEHASEEGLVQVFAAKLKLDETRGWRRRVAGM